MFKGKLFSGFLFLSSYLDAVENRHLLEEQEAKEKGRQEARKKREAEQEALEKEKQEVNDKKEQATNWMELQELLEQEEICPGFFARIIISDLKRLTNNNAWAHYFGIQASSNTRGSGEHLYQRSFTWDGDDLSQLYEREDKEKHGLGYKKSKKSFANDILKSHLSVFTSDLAKKDILKNIYNINLNAHDFNRSIYDLLRIMYKKADFKRFSSSILSFSKASPSFNKLKSKENKHFLETIIVDHFKALILKMGPTLKSDQVTHRICYWLNVIFKYINALDLNQRIKKEASLAENQKYYDVLCCLYEAYHHLVFMLMSYVTEQDGEIYKYGDYKSIMKTIHEKRLPQEIQPYIKDSYVTKSGMDACTKALCLVQSLAGKGDHNPEIIPITESKVEAAYYEIGPLLGFGHAFRYGRVNKSDISLTLPFVAIGLSSAQYNSEGQYQTNKVIETIETKIDLAGKCILLIDNTVELPDREQDPAYKLLKNEKIIQWIKQEKLVIFLAKSFQKFATIGTQKMRAGNLSLIGKGEMIEPFQTYFKNNFDDIYDHWKTDLQWLIHTLSVDKEIDMLNECNINVKKIYEKLDEKEELIQSFSMIIFKGRHLKKGYFGKEFDSIFPFYMQSFGYPFCLATEYPSGVRLNIGLEPEILQNQLIDVLSNDYSKKAPTVTGAWKNNLFYTYRPYGVIKNLEDFFEKYLIPVLKEHPEKYQKALDWITKRIKKYCDKSLKVIQDVQKINGEISFTESFKAAKDIEDFTKEKPLIKCWENKDFKDNTLLRQYLAYMCFPAEKCLYTSEEKFKNVNDENFVKEFHKFKEKNIINYADEYRNEKLKRLKGHDENIKTKKINIILQKVNKFFINPLFDSIETVIRRGVANDYEITFEDFLKKHPEFKEKQNTEEIFNSAKEQLIALDIEPIIEKSSHLLKDNYISIFVNNLLRDGIIVPREEYFCRNVMEGYEDKDSMLAHDRKDELKKICTFDEKKMLQHYETNKELYKKKIILQPFYAKLNLNDLAMDKSEISVIIRDVLDNKEINAAGKKDIFNKIYEKIKEIYRDKENIEKEAIECVNREEERIKEAVEKEANEQAVQRCRKEYIDFCFPLYRDNANTLQELKKALTEKLNDIKTSTENLKGHKTSLTKFLIQSLADEELIPFLENPSQKYIDEYSKILERIKDRNEFTEMKNIIQSAKMDLEKMPKIQ